MSFVCLSFSDQFLACVGLMVFGVKTYHSKFKALARGDSNKISKLESNDMSGTAATLATDRSSVSMASPYKVHDVFRDFEFD